MYKLKLVIVFAGILFWSGCQSQSNLESRNKDLVRRYVDELLNKSDYSRAYEIITPDFTLYDNGQEAPYKGVDLFKAADEAEDLSELVLTIEEMVVEGNTVVMRWYDKALYTPAGLTDDSRHPKPLKWYGISLYRIEDGRIVEGYVMNDMNTIQKQIDEYQFCRAESTANVQRAERNKATVKRYVDELVNNTSGDYSKAYEIISPEFTLCFGGTAFDAKGVDVFKKTGELKTKSFSMLMLIDDEMIAEGNTVAVRWHDEAIHDKGDFQGYEVVPNDTNITWHGMSFYKFDDNGLMTEAYVVDDGIEVLEMRQRAVEQDDQK